MPSAVDDMTVLREFIPKFESYENSFGIQTRPSFDSIYMEMALSLAKRSTCCRKHVGSVFVSDDYGQVLCVGYNGNFSGGPNECDSLEPGICFCIHAENNCLVKATSSLKNSICYVTSSPCRMCAKLLINRDIKRVVYFEDYRDMSSIAMMQSTGITVEKF